VSAFFRRSADGRLGIVARLLLVGAGLACVVLLGEVAARGYYRLAHGIPFFGTRTHYTTHPVFGWVGHRVFGDATTTRTRLMVVGDSMTNGLGVPARQLYFALLGDALDVEVFAYGGAGYGTLQEYLVVDHYPPTVRPHLVLLQTSGNDFVNNAWALERASYHHNNLAVRPYLESDRIVYRFPSRLGDWSALLARSRLAYYLAVDGAIVGATLAGRGWLRGVEDEIRRDPAFPPFRQAVATTETLVAMLKARVAPTPLVAFAADDGGDAWRDIFARQAVPFVEDVPRRIGDAEARGLAVRFDGVHWTAEGHRIAAAVLADALRPRVTRRRASEPTGFLDGRGAAP
jgi:hypothetical protein